MCHTCVIQATLYTQCTDYTVQELKIMCLSAKNKVVFTTFPLFFMKRCILRPAVGPLWQYGSISWRKFKKRNITWHVNHLLQKVNEEVDYTLVCGCSSLTAINELDLRRSENFCLHFLRHRSPAVRLIVALLYSMFMIVYLKYAQPHSDCALSVINYKWKHLHYHTSVGSGISLRKTVLELYTYVAKQCNVVSKMKWLSKAR